jgi:hypothetical protein
MRALHERKLAADVTASLAFELLFLKHDSEVVHLLHLDFAVAAIDRDHVMAGVKCPSNEGPLHLRFFRLSSAKSAVHAGHECAHSPSGPL